MELFMLGLLTGLLTDLIIHIIVHNDETNIKVLRFIYRKGCEIQRKKIRKYLIEYNEPEVTPPFPFNDDSYRRNSPMGILTKDIWDKELKNYLNTSIINEEPDIQKVTYKVIQQRKRNERYLEDLRSNAEGKQLTYSHDNDY